MAKKTITYSEAYSEIEKIIEEIESDELEIDYLSEKVKRVSELLKICKSKLFDTEKAVEKILKEIK